MQSKSYKSKKGGLKLILECWPGAPYIPFCLKAEADFMNWALRLNAQMGGISTVPGMGTGRHCSLRI